MVDFVFLLCFVTALCVPRIHFVTCLPSHLFLGRDVFGSYTYFEVQLQSCMLHIINPEAYFLGSDYGYACPDAIQIKGSVCHSNGVDVVTSCLGVSYALRLLCQWFSVQLSPC